MKEKEREREACFDAPSAPLPAATEAFYFSCQRTIGADADTDADADVARVQTSVAIKSRGRVVVLIVVVLAAVPVFSSQ